MLSAPLLAATCCNSTILGSLLFAAADCHTFNTIANSKDSDILSKIVPAWWFNGAKLMIPLNLLNVSSSLWLAFVRREPLSYLNVGLAFGIIAFTAVVMKEDIKALTTNGKDLKETLNGFYWKHLVRVCLSGGGLLTCAWLIYQ